MLQCMVIKVIFARLCLRNIYHTVTANGDRTSPVESVTKCHGLKGGHSAARRKGVKMFEIFGYMETAEEINKTAAGLKAEGDIENLKKLAEENGLPLDIVDVYVSGEIDFIADTVAAAIGKIQLEEAELKPEEIMKDWVEYLKVQCMENEQLAVAVRKKNKTLKGCMGELLKWSHANMKDVDKDIQKAAGFTGKVKLGIPGMGRAKKIIKDYYLKEAAK